jgi:hypothetical protein
MLVIYINICIFFVSVLTGFELKGATKEARTLRNLARERGVFGLRRCESTPEIKTPLRNRTI